MSAGSTLAMLAANARRACSDLSSDLRNVSIRDQVVRAQCWCASCCRSPNASAYW